MDKNKLKVLREIGYKIPQSCSLCQHAEFQAGGWGTCKVQQYDHLKHTGPARQLSIFAGGWCPKFDPDEELVGNLGSWAEFVETEK